MRLNPRREGQRLSQVFVEHVREARAQQKLTQGQLAARAKLSRVYVNMLENGRASPTLATVGAIATALGLHASDMLIEAPF